MIIKDITETKSKKQSKIVEPFEFSKKKVFKPFKGLSTTNLSFELDDIMDKIDNFNVLLHNAIHTASLDTKDILKINKQKEELDKLRIKFIDGCKKTIDILDEIEIIKE